MKFALKQVPIRNYVVKTNDEKPCKRKEPYEYGANNWHSNFIWLYRWICKVKYNSDGTINVRFGVKSYAQTYCLDYKEMFSLIAKMLSPRSTILLPCIKIGNFTECLMDTKNAFLKVI